MSIPTSLALVKYAPGIVGLLLGFGMLIGSSTLTNAQEVVEGVFSENTLDAVVGSEGISGVVIKDQTSQSLADTVASTESAVLVDAPFTRSSTSVITGLIVVVVALSFIVFAMIVLTVWLYQWRLRFRDAEGRTFRTVVPERFINWLHEQSDRIKESIKRQAAAAEDVRTLRTSFAGLHESTLVETKKIRDMLEIHRSLLEEKDEEIKRLKSLYETAVFHRFVRRFVEVDRFITDVLEAGDVRNDDLKKTQTFLRDALDECHVEMFSDEVIGKPFRELGELVEDNPEQEPTHNPDQHGLVSRVSEVGYRLQALEESAVVRPARVTVFQAIEQPGH